MIRLRHVSDLTIAQAGNYSWPLSDVESTVQLCVVGNGSWDIKFQSAGANPDPTSYINIPIDSNVDYCLLRLTGAVIRQGLKPAQGAPTFEAAHVPFGAEGYLYGWAWGWPRNTSGQFPEASAANDGKVDAWGSQSIGMPGQFVSPLPPYFGLSANNLSQTSTAGRLTPQGFLLNTTTGVGFNTTPGDRFSVAFPVGRLRSSGEFSVSGLKRLVVRLSMTQPTFDWALGYSAFYDYFNVSLRLSAHFYEATERDPY